ncbi:DUF305 domain-containing protein [Sphingomonas oleivorans]|uniref:DUF305 domain-containing protein n=1 Tax=Sphingomonas oleivorans TaxID=1735121 RepID=A0A2T5G099_9SPHN|nr:DUF305 domain-containing protein [Sphingomonas oleivorans]PTQ12391.1 DUF305 domain-containing protein [Sphingomonas oleivorans]
MSTKPMIALLAALAAASPAFAKSGGAQEMPHRSMAGMDRMMQPTEADPYPPAEMRMHERVMMATGADATETWVRKMIEHHRGGIEISDLVLARTTDAKVRKIATRTIAAQRKAIDALQKWLKQNDKTPQ